MKHLRNCIIAAAALLTAIVTGASRPGADDLKFKTEAPDLDAIQAATYDRHSPYYYPRLMEEYQRNDTLMKLDKFRHLYFGYMFQEDYNPYRPKAFEPDAENLINRREWTRGECDSVIKYSEKALENNPFDLRHMMNLISALKTKGKRNLAKIWQYKLDFILMAIVSSGTGMDEENAWVVISPEHEYVLLNAMGLVAEKHIFFEPYYELISAKKPDGSTATYYFNIATILEEYYRKYPVTE